MNNYIPDTNPFKLSGPPIWWLRQLWEFDNSLVVVPSRQSCMYRLAQRRQLQLPEHMTNDMLFKESDTRMLAQYGLIPVTSILSTANWSNPYMFEELRRRAPWRMGGAEKVIKDVEDHEWKQELDKRAVTDDQLNYLGKDAWKYYNKLIGLRSQLWTPKTPNRIPKPQGKAPLIKIAHK